MINKFLFTPGKTICPARLGVLLLNQRCISSTSVVGNKFGKSNWSSGGNARQRSNQDVGRVKKRLVSIDDYNKSVDMFYEKICSGVAPMKNLNVGFAVDKIISDDNEKILSLVLGEDCEYDTLVMQTVNKDRTLDYFSPISGKLIYSYCNDTNTFRSVDDDHDLLGILTRDLIKDAKGFPQF